MREPLRLPPAVIVCVDCGGRAHLLSKWDEEDPPQPGEVATYRCEDCLDRWDLIIEEEDISGPEEPD